MDFTLTRNWWILALRGVLAILFGILVFFWPGLAWLVVVASFGAYALVDGVFALVSAFSPQARDGPWWALLGEGLLGIAAGVATFFWPEITGLVLLYLIAYWSIATGVLQVITAIRLNRYIQNEWLLALGGILSVLFGIVLVLMPVEGALAVAWLIGAYSIAFGAVLLALGLQLRSWGRRGARLPQP